jgi:hypothetical protein
MSDTVFFHSDSEIEAMVDRLEVCDFEKVSSLTPCTWRPRRGIYPYIRPKRLSSICAPP